MMGALLAPLSVQAQDSYSPPPMFEDMTPPMVRPDFDGDYIRQPKTSTDPDAVQPRPATITPHLSEQPKIPVAPSVQQPAAPEAPKLMKPIVEETQPKREKPPVRKDDERTASPAVKIVTPPKKPVAPVAPATAVTPLAPEQQTSPVTEPLQKNDVPLPPSAAGPVIEPVTRDPKQSAITGPKTMPSLPIQSVDGQVTFDEAPAPQEPTIMERVNPPAPPATVAPSTIAKQNDDTLIPVSPAPKEGVEPAVFDSGTQNVLKKSIVFQPGQIGLVAADSDPIVAGVITELKNKDDWRVQIKAYATPHGTGVSSDRRIALGRALSLRSSLIEQGFPAARVDILAEGLQTDATKPGDRIDLYLYGPKVE